MGKDYRYRLGIDIGGTFTDFTLVDIRNASTVNLKVPTTPGKPEKGVEAGIDILQNEYGLDVEEIQYFVHGMTIGLNTLLQRVGSKCALLVTEGFRDILNLQRGRLPIPYDFRSFLPDPLIPRRFVYGIPERFDAAGNEIIPLDVDAVDAAVEDAISHGIEAVTVAFLHSYRTPDHERQAIARIAKVHPEIRVCGSSEIWPEIREYERTIAAVSNLYIQNNVRTYFADLESMLKRKGLRVRPFVTQSNGGIMDLESAAAAPVKTLFSGPASGVIGAIREASLAGITNVLTFDMGGTSTDISVVSDGKATYTNASEIGGMPIVLPAIDIATVGAGGGSIAWVDASGLLKVGPESAGSNPGPACYGRSEIPTMTDAFILCGYVSPRRFGGGRVFLDTGRSESAIEKLAVKLGKQAIDVADDIVRVAISNMYAEISNSMEQRGYDPRDLTIVAYGGGGPVTANIVAQEINAQAVFVPYRPGTLCATGALSAGFTYDAVSAEQLEIARETEDEVNARFENLEAEARAWLAAQETDIIDLSSAVVERFVDARYFGQSYELQVPVAGKGKVPTSALDITCAFNDAHRHLYGHAEQGSPIEVVNLRVRINAATLTLPSTELSLGEGGPVRPFDSRQVRFDGVDYQADVYSRDNLREGDSIAGPAVVEQDDTTVVIIPGWHATVDKHLNILITRVVA